MARRPVTKTPAPTASTPRSCPPTERPPEELPPFDLSDEVHLLRVLIRRAVSQCPTDATLSETLEVLRGVSMGFFALARVMCTSQLLGPNPLDELQAILGEAMTQVVAELEAEPTTTPPPLLPTFKPEPEDS